MNSLDNNGKEFLQLNSPGNDGYGQRGSRGDKGTEGNSVYFTPYIFETRGEYNAECVELINNGRELSNNPQYPSSHINYKDNDYIIDKHGYAYMIKAISAELPQDKFMKMQNLFSGGSGIGLQCRMHIGETRDSSFYYKVPNESYIGPYNDNTGSPYIYHRDRYNGYFCGSWLRFEVSASADVNYAYKYVLRLPNGLKIENMAYTSTYEMFVDNRILYTCFFDSATNEELKTYGNYHNVEETDEYSFEFSRKLAEVMTATCTAYVEVTDKDSGKVYRKYATEITIQENDND